MADNVTTPVPAGAVLAADDVNGVMYPRTKMSWGADNSAVDVSATNPLPVTVPSTVATGVKQDTMIASLNTISGYIDTLEALVAAATAATQVVGTRAYGPAIGRLTYGSTSVRSAAITAGEVMLHNCGTGRCFVEAGTAGSVVATTDSTPLEPGEKFHLRITTGQAIAVIQETASGALNLRPVA